MKVILLQDVPILGKADDVKEVAEGYARNYLFPKHWAVQANSQALADLAAHRQRLAKQAERDLELRQKQAEQIDGVELFFKEKASEKNLLYSAITPVKVADKLKALGMVVDKKQIVMEPVKTLGDFTAKIKFPHGLEAEVKIIVSTQ